MEQGNQKRTLRSDNRVRQMRYIASVLKNSKTNVLSSVAPDDFEKQVICWDKMLADTLCPVSEYEKIKDEFEAELRDFSIYMGLDMKECAIWIAMLAIKLTSLADQIEIRKIMKYFDLDEINEMTINSILDKLCEKSYAMRQFGYDISYKINNSIYGCIMNNKNVVVEEFDEMDAFEFCSCVSNIICETDNVEDLSRELGLLESANNHLTMISELTKHNLSLLNRVLFYEICEDCSSGVKSDVKKTCKDIFQNGMGMTDTIYHLTHKDHVLVNLGLVEILDNSFEDSSEMTLTEKGIAFAFGDANTKLFSLTDTKSGKLTLPTAIEEREMFYSGQLSKDVGLIEGILRDDSLAMLQKRLKEKHMGYGVAMLFYGGPGTGKTETVMQLARRCNRSVYRVELSNTKTCWYGESEKLVKNIFSNYEKLIHREERTPILLFNEADAILGKRSDNPEHSVDKTDNAIQNIILEEMERLNGIMIATTNLEGNLDKAFERRFLFKVRFDNPSAEVKCSIWSSKIKGLDDSSYKMLADRFDFSGGEIDNIARKMAMEELLLGEKPSLQKLNELCEKERIANRKNKIGF